MQEDPARSPAPDGSVTSMQASRAEAAVDVGSFSIDTRGKGGARLVSDRNQPPSLLSDVAPGRLRRDDNDGKRREVSFPIVDLDLGPDWSLEVDFVRPPAEVLFNGVRFPPSMRVSVPSSVVSKWENTLVSDVPPRSIAFASSKEGILRLTPLGAGWHGFAELGEVENRLDIAPPAASAGLFHDALSACVDYLIDSRVNDPNSPYFGGFHLFYDYDARAWRAPHWVWTWGPAIAVLSKVGAVVGGPSSDVGELARAAGERSLRHVVDVGTLRGFATVRRDVDPAAPTGYWSKISIADTGFLAGWGWSTLTKERDDEFGHALTEFGSGVDRTLDLLEVVPQDFVVEKSAWTPSTLDESLIGVEALAALHRLRPGADTVERVHRYVDPVLHRLERPDGLYDRGWRRRDGSRIPSKFGSKDAAWVVEGLLAAHEVDAEADYLARAVAVAEFVCDRQSVDGGWSTFLDTSAEECGVDEKAVAIWAYLLQRLARMTGSGTYRDHSRHAISYLTERQDLSSARREGWGGVPGRSPRSGIMYREWFRLSCSYTVSFLALALLEETANG